MTITDSSILDCGHAPSAHSSFTTGYGTDKHGKTFCYACCAENDKAQMVADGKTTLYMVKDDTGNTRITNWPNSLSFPVGHVRKGRHNIARNRYDAWFTGPDGATWHAVQYGDNTQIAHCKRVKG